MSEEPPVLLVEPNNTSQQEPTAKLPLSYAQLLKNKNDTSSSSTEVSQPSTTPTPSLLQTPSSSTTTSIEPSSSPLPTINEIIDQVTNKNKSTNTNRGDSKTDLKSNTCNERSCPSTPSTTTYSTPSSSPKDKLSRKQQTKNTYKSINADSASSSSSTTLVDSVQEEGMSKPTPVPAPIPTVNIWQVRKDRAATTSVNVDAEKVCEGSTIKETDAKLEKDGDGNGPPVKKPAAKKFPKRASTSSTLSSTSNKNVAPILSLDDPNAWPSPATALDKEKEIIREKNASSSSSEIVAEDDSPTIRKAGKAKWVPLTPTIIHSTPTPGMHHFHHASNHRGGAKDRRIPEKDVAQNTGVFGNEKSQGQRSKVTSSVISAGEREQNKEVSVKTDTSSTAAPSSQSANSQQNTTLHTAGNHHTGNGNGGYRGSRPSRRGQGSVGRHPRPPRPYHQQQQHQQHYHYPTNPLAPFGPNLNVALNVVPAPGGYPYPPPVATVSPRSSFSTTSTGGMGSMMPISVSVQGRAASTLLNTEALKFYILGQMEYYFSVENLVRDVYFRRQMDGEGWIPITVLAGFNRIRALTTDVNLVRDALMSSKIVEVQGMRVRKRDGWVVWLFPEEQRIPHPSVAEPQATPSLKSSQDDVVVQKSREREKQVEEKVASSSSSSPKNDIPSSEESAVTSTDPVTQNKANDTIAKQDDNNGTLEIPMTTVHCTPLSPPASPKLCGQVLIADDQKSESAHHPRVSGASVIASVGPLRTTAVTTASDGL